MENNFKKAMKALFLSAMMAVMVSCEKNDDINAIFRERTWYVTFVKEGNTTEYSKGKLYSIEFKNTLTATMPNGAAFPAAGRTASSASSLFRLTAVNFLLRTS